MLPGCIAKLYNDPDLIVHFQPIAFWAGASYTQSAVKKIEANKNTVHLEDGSSLVYDILSINIGSKSKERDVPGVNEYALKTRPINKLLPQITVKEIEMKEKGIIPDLAVCGEGIDGVEMVFGFKARWEAYFG